MDRFFIAIYNYFEKHKLQMWLAAIISFLLVGFLASRIKLEEDITKIFPHEKKLAKLQTIFQDSRFADKLVLTISQKDTTKEAQPDALTAYADAFSEKANTVLAPYIKRLQGKNNDSAIMGMMNGIQNDLPIYLTKEDYKSIDSLLTPERIKKQLEYDRNTLISPAGYVLKKTIQADPAGISWIAIKKLRNLQYDSHFELYDGYVMTKDHKNLLLFIVPANPPNATGKNIFFLQHLDNVLDSLQQQYPNVSSSYFGALAVSAGNATQLKKDTILTQGITLLLLIVFISLYFRKKRAPLLIMVPVIFGGLFSLAVVYLLKGHMSVVALGAGSIVLGIAVNYSLHVFNHYRHSQNMHEVIEDVASPMTIGSFTTIGGFLCLMLVPSPLLNDMGLFAAFSLVGATLYSLIFLPHWIIIGKKQLPAHTEHQYAHSWLDKLSELKPEKNKYLVAGIFLLTIVFLFTARKVSFESDMLKMNFMTPKLKQAEEKFNAVNAYTAQSLYLVTEGNTIEEALENNEHIIPRLKQLQQEGVVKKMAGVNNLLLSVKEQQTRIDRWNDYWTPAKKQQLLTQLKKEGATLGFSATAFDQFSQLLDKQFTTTPVSDMQVLHSGMLNDFIIEKHGKVMLVTLLKVDRSQKALVHKALDNDPNVTILDKQYAANSLVKEINNEFNNIAWMTSLLVFVALLLSYGRIELTLITFIPMLISWVWILGIMGLLGIKFNIVNIILSTFIFGLGDDYSIFIMDGLQQQYKTGKKHLASFKSSIFLSAITTVLGLGILIFAKHPSLKSIALISIIGICCVVLTSQVLIPFLFNWLVVNRVKKNRPPWTLFGWAKSVFAFTYFTVGSILVTIAGIFLLKLNPFPKRRVRYIYHTLISKFTWSLLYIMGNVKKKFINPLKEDLSKPAVIVSNHQSFLDILVTTALNPKIILLTNKWVWRSPVFGALVRMGGYYLVDEGVENSLDKLKEKVAQGYSIAVYPEGTRSVTGEIKRFHKGAFYIAEQLGLDILPVVIHGTAYTMTKGDFLLKDGVITVKYMPRIKPGDENWGANYTERTKSITRYFREEYAKMCHEIETTSYYREQLIYNYLYKGPVLEWYMRIKTRIEKNYKLFHELLPAKGRILDIGCGYGFMSYMLCFLSKDRYITGIDYDEEKVAVADHCYLKTERQQFIAADVTQYEFGRYDAFVMMDVLHYLQPDQQEQLIKKCLDNLEEGGIILLRDGDAELKERHKRTKLAEFFSTKAIGFNKTSDQPLSFTSASKIRTISEKYGATTERIDDSNYTSDIIFVIRKLPTNNNA